jgi:hypothetical protein
MSVESTQDEQRSAVAVHRLVRRLLVQTGIVDAEAIDDPEGYDGGVTLACADQMARCLTHVCPVCWEEMSVNWRDGQPYDYCPEHGEPNASDHQCSPEASATDTER